MVKNKFIFPIVFAFGAACGALVSGMYLKKKYEQYAQEEIESIKEAYRRKSGKSMIDIPKEEPMHEETKQDENPEGKRYYAKLLKQYGYPDAKEIAGMRVISPDEFASLVCGGDYDIYDYSYHSNGIISNEDHERVDDLFSDEILSHFGEYEEDSLHIVDDSKNCMYEILRDESSFDSDAPKKWED